MDQDTDTSTLTAIVQKRFSFENHGVSVGLQGRYKAFIMDNIRYDGALSPAKQTYDKESIYSLFIEDLIMLSQKTLFSFSLMQQYYDRGQNMKDESLTQARASYVYSSDKFVSKTFVARQEFVPEPFMTAEAHVGNPQLEPEIYKSITQEFHYKNKKTLSKLIFGYTRVEGFLVPDTQGIMQNSQKYFYTEYAGVELTYSFREKDKLTELSHLISIKK